MKANELRIGNLIIYEATTHILTSVSDSGICTSDWARNPKESYNHHISEAMPIPLDKEWLYKLGAAKFEKEIWISLPNLKAELHFEVYTRELHGTEVVSIIKSPFCELILVELKYVHQLQNLYFALTNKELTFKTH